MLEAFGDLCLAVNDMSLMSFILLWLQIMLVEQEQGDIG